MVKAKEHYTLVYGRANKLKQGLLAIFFDISSYPRLLAEVFLRHNMGVRYFSLMHCIYLLAVLLVLPFILAPGETWHDTILEHWGWYLFLVAFGKCAWSRYKECKRPYGYFDFNHFSKSTGDRLRQVEAFKFRGKRITPRSMDVYAEPILIISVGLIAFLLGQEMLGRLLAICGCIYRLSYVAAYDIGRNMVLDDIDGSIAARDLSQTFLSDEPVASNFKFFGPKPTTAEAREGFAALYAEDDEGTEVA